MIEGVNVNTIVIVESGIVAREDTAVTEDMIGIAGIETVVAHAHAHGVVVAIVVVTAGIVAESVVAVSAAVEDVRNEIASERKSMSASGIGSVIVTVRRHEIAKGIELAEGAIGLEAPRPGAGALLDVVGGLVLEPGIERSRKKVGRTKHAHHKIERKEEGI